MIPKTYKLLTSFFSPDEIEALRILTKNPDMGTRSWIQVPSNALVHIYDTSEYTVGATIAALKLAHHVLEQYSARTDQQWLGKADQLVLAGQISALSPDVGNALIDFIG